jgi:hypothetical protein
MAYKIKKQKLKEKEKKFEYYTFSSEKEAENFKKRITSFDNGYSPYLYKLKGKRVYRYKKIEY